MWELKNEADMVKIEYCKNLIQPLKYLFKDKFMNTFRFMMHNHVLVSKRPTEVLDESVRSEGRE